MDPPSSFRVPASPGTPLYALSPERINQQRLPPSPSLPTQLDKHSHHRSPSDVASKVAFLNSLNHGGGTSPTRSAASSHAALQRAILGREEAEAQLQENNARLAEAQVRERRISERVESLMEELQAVKERQIHERQVFEKEVRRARKDAFKAGSTLVKAQEVLKEARTEAAAMRAEVQHEKSAKEMARQEAFERAYTLAGIMEEMEVMRETLRGAEAERDAVLRELQARTINEQEQGGATSVEVNKELEAQGPLEKTPEQRKPDNFLRRRSSSRRERSVQSKSPTRRGRRNRFDRLLPVNSPESTPLITWGVKPKSRSQKNAAEPAQEEDEDYEDLMRDHSPDMEEQIEDLQAQLRWEKTLTDRAEEMVHFLQMECQFKMCACRIAEQQGTRFIHDHEWERKLRTESAERKKNAEAAADNEADEEIAAEIAAQGGEVAVDESDAAFEIPTSDQDQDFKDLEPAGEAEQRRMRQEEDPDPEVAEPIRRSVPAIDNVFHSSAPLLQPEMRANTDQDLFELSPSKQLLSRPSTSMGFMNMVSPIRVVPCSPLYPSTNLVEEGPMDSSAARFTSSPKSTKSTTTRSPSPSPYPITPALKTPTRPRTVQAQTTTIMVPLRGLEDDDVFSPASQNIPGTPISREAALAQIRARRDRARSVNLKTIGCKSAPGSARRGLGGGLRDISAPGRF